MARPSKEAAVSTPLAPALLRYAAARTLDVEALAAHLDVPAAAAERDEVTTTPSCLAAALRALSELLAEPHLALTLPAALPMQRYDAATLAIRNARTVREALELSARYAPLVFPGLEARCVEDDGELAFHGRIGGHPRGLGYAVDAFVLATVLGHCRRRTAAALAPRRAWLSASRPTTLEPLFAALGTREIELGAEDIGVALGVAEAERPLDGADPMLLATAQHLAAAQLAAAPRPSAFAAAVSARVEASLPTLATPEEVAAAMRVSTRTLQRRLEDEGTRFSELVDVVRERQARRLLGDASLPLAEISFRLGFADLATFSRAFKRWTGTPPGAFRRRTTRLS